ncbi:other/FunK1 protein kinase [Coprinopsis cinerea okayama7|uniref:Other/FunK1 protein kinase n=1 Tax=Coprinopsis cinerea (strain Okayama-7 / 130 / ATCC MYA-4618 / FGSC 9003) TaxID=240176 RepID=A8P950_COPC7|nr:other/FunK1 protein kinase [Coprinopsis cinerea okayama7\|eukprot:XP_001839697.2 other/FunK1 protein kinase [Coprinopsis cinerea okayama7\
MSLPGIFTQQCDTRPRSDTNIKPQMTTSFAPTKAQDVRDAVESDVRHNIRVCERQAFVDRLFPMKPDVVQKIIQDLEDTGWYSPTSGWKGLPQEPGGAEGEYYHPYTQILDAIDSAALSHGERDIDHVPGKWLDRHDITPKCNVKNTSKLRPDLNNLILHPDRDAPEKFVECLKDVHEAEIELEETCTTVEGDSKPASKRTKATVPRSESERQKSAESLTVSWLRTRGVVEIKTRYWLNDIWPTTLQLCTYLRQILREQHDRRFVFGFIFFHRSLAIWHSDRSGLLGVKQVINIDDNLELFVQVMSSFALMGAERLGFDPNMKMVVPGCAPAFSYALPFDRIPKHRHKLHWQITIKGVTYQTVEILSVARSEIMCGRAPLVWRAVQLDKLESPKPELVIIKQGWRPDMGGPSELGIYDILKVPCPEKSGAAQCVVGEDVAGSHTEKDLRRGLSSERFVIAAHQPDTYPEPRDEKILLHMGSVKPDDDDRYMPRIQHRLVNPVNGLPLKMFGDLLELLDVIIDVLKAYQHAYYEKGVCHRDISLGNIVIECEKRLGRLIDFDHAKNLPDYISRTVSSLRNEFAEHMAELHQFRERNELPRLSDNLALLLLYLAKINLSDDDESLEDWEDPKATARRTNLSADQVTKRLRLDKIKGEIKISDVIPLLGDDPYLPPNFGNRRSVHTFCTGTVPFMAHDIGRETVRTAKHDMESMLWVLVYIGITRDGLGGKSRPEPKEARGELHDAAVRRFFLFESNRPQATHIDTKKAFLRSQEAILDDHVFRYFHADLKPLKSLIVKWKDIIHKASNGNLVYAHYAPVAFLQAAMDVRAEFAAHPVVIAQSEQGKHRREAQKRKMNSILRRGIDLVRSAIDEEDHDGSTTPTNECPPHPALDMSPSGKDRGGPNPLLAVR